MPQVKNIAEIATQFGLTIPDTIRPFIAGQTRDAIDQLDPLTHICPATEETLYTIQSCGPATVDAAVNAARDAFDNSGWSRLSHAERKPVLRRLIDCISTHQDELATIQALEVGLPLSGLRVMHMPRTMENFDFFIEVAGTMGGHAYTQTGRYTSVVTREPTGVVALITPWNAPLVLSSMKMAAALALGNTCVIKASEYSPWSLLRFMQVLQEADLPPGVINLVNGPGAITGQALVEHPEVDVVGFVGGTETGKSIIRSSAAGIKKVGLELGGKSANMVFDSADLEAAIDGSLIAILAGNGEQCLAGSRVLLQEGIADAFIEQFTQRLRNIRIGDPFAEGTELGPLAFARHRDKVMGYVDIATAEGASVLTGGQLAKGFDSGYFVEPTAVLAPDNSLRVCQEEIFGPFVAIQRFKTPEEALAIANDSPFGLVSYVWSEHLPTVMQVSRGLRAGTVWVNTPLTRDLRAPFGGYKQSGIGRDGLHASIDLMTEEKTTMLPNAALWVPKMGMDS